MDEYDELVEQAEALGLKVDGRWGVDRLRAEVEAARADADQKAPETAAISPESQDPGEAGHPGEPAGGSSMGYSGGHTDADDEPLRAGGHVDHGDGRGWMLEKDDE